MSGAAEQPSVLLCCSDEEAQQYLLDFLDLFGYSVCGVTEYVEDCAAEIRSLRPDILIIDVELFDSCLAYLMETTGQKHNATTLLVVADSVGKPRNSELSQNMDITYYTTLPFDYLTFHKTLQEALENRHVSRTTDPKGNFLWKNASGSIIELVRYHLQKGGITAEMLGYYYIIDGVLLILEDKTFLHALTNRLYPLIAKRHGSTPAGVERALRGAVHRMWERGDGEYISKTFGDPCGKCPTVGQYLSVLTEIARSRFYTP